MTDSEQMYARHPFAEVMSKADKRNRGQTSANHTPLTVRAVGLALDAGTRGRARERFGLKLGKFAPHIERVSVRLEDENGPRGGFDIVCRVKVVLSGIDSVLFAERAESVDLALARALRRVDRSVQRALEKGGAASRNDEGGDEEPSEIAAAVEPAAGRWRKRNPAPPPAEGSLIGRRVGHATENLLRAADRPEKRRRDQPVDTAEPGRSATDRRAGGGSTAGRNTKVNTAGLTSALEDSARDRPSRKSTRKAAGRAKRDNNLQQRQVRRVRSPKARAASGS
jgi:hypothetical protein